jgi:hypothetical protein
MRTLFPSRLITSNFASLLIVFRRFFILFALGDVDLRVSQTLVRKANVVEGGTTLSP